MSQPNFTSVLDTPMDSIERPKPIPTGVWIGQVVGLPVVREVTTKNGEQQTINVNVKLTSPKQVDDPDSLTAYGDIASARPVQRTFWFSKPSPTPEELWAFKQFAKNTLGMNTDGKSLKAVCAEMQGKQLLVTIGHNTYPDKNTGEMVIGSQVTQTAAI